MPSFRDDQILIISPGSQTTLAQLGLPESFTPAKIRLPSRMYPGLEEGTWTPFKVRELREGEDLAQLLGVKNDKNKKGGSGKVKKDVVVGNGAPKVTKLEEGSKPEGVKDTGSGIQEEKPASEKVTSTEGGAIPAIEAAAPVPALALGPAKETPKPTVDDDTEIPDADDNENDEDDLEEGELEEGDEGEQEGEGEEEAPEAEEMALSDDEDLAEGEQIIEDIIEIPEAENGVILVEDEDEDDGAVYPMQQGRVANWGAFFALLTYVHELINPTLNTPILIVYPPIWTRYDKELVTQFVFEKLKAPGLCLLDSALAVCWAYGISTATVIDVGYEKTDITPVLDFVVGEIERDTIFVGGEDMTQHLMKILGGEEKGWGRDMAEQLKCSPICEILDGSKINIPGQGTEKISDLVKKGKKLGKDINVLPTEADDDDGAPNVAAIVASGKTREYLEKKEKEKQEAAKGAKNLPNWRRDTNKFWVIEKRKPGEAMDIEMADHWEQTEHREEKPDEPMADSSTPPAPTLGKQTSTDAPQASSRSGTSSGAPPGSRPGTSSGVPPTGSRPGTSAGPADGEPESEEARLKAEAKEKRKEEKRAKNQQEVEQIQLRPNECRREVEVGIERFQAAEGGIITTIADAMYRIIMRVDDVSRRQELWDNLVVVGNASRVKGFKDSLLQTLIEKYKISPSSASIFTSELPSSASTPLPTGASTPIPGAGSSSGVNPLLVAATTNPLHQGGGQQHSSHSLSPMNMKFAKAPEYFPEWKDVGFEEAAFLGAQVAAKVVFVVDQGINRGFLSRMEYNDLGPGGVHSV
ncbi:actin-like ATPase domain-containing protein [Terfezia boudieri ATCC MYA-4762]|uniref:Actin-like ATPase domain-containing protein n=1 Tax=Terfezia boudieri ATCC MYA-4762 TaxID=1051890 RepID=A0A3N4LQ65_9PEZI|nr:actin-like ATPase domain-containing protein [Terfezia boudieri ATCC MYA-4762]